MDHTAIEKGDFNIFLRVMGDVLLEIDHQAVVTKLSHNGSEIMGRSVAVGDQFMDFIHPDDHSLFNLVRTKLARHRKIGPAPFRVIKENGKEGAVDIDAVSLRRSGQIHIQMMIRPFKGDLVLPSLYSRPGTNQHREFTAGNFMKLAARLTDYAAGLGLSEAQALMKLSGYDDPAQSHEDRLWALCRLLNDSAIEGVESDTPGKTGGRKAGASAPDVAPDLQDNMDKALKTDGSFLRVETITGDDGLSESEAVKAAVFSLQQASKDGKSITMTGLTEGYEKRLERSKSQLRAFKAIVTQEHFDIALQPIVAIDTGDVHHYEALCRFKPEVYDGSPYHFMCFAEEMGVIHEFDLAMTLKAIHMIKRLKTIGYNISVAVNISGKSIQSAIFQRHFFRILEDCGDIRKNLIFELTESSQIDNLQATNKILSRIREFGHKVCLDDFGAGAAGLQYLRALKVDTVKIDGIYIRQGIEKAENRSFLKSMADLCNQLDIETVGECVEDEAQLSFLKDIGVTYAQGWYYGKPVPVEEALEQMA